jgi:hypothetical protein
MSGWDDSWLKRRSTGEKRTVTGDMMMMMMMMMMMIMINSDQ